MGFQTEALSTESELERPRLAVVPPVGLDKTQCKVCIAPKISRELIEKMRLAEISYRDVSNFMKIGKRYDISHASIQRHEADGHFSPDGILPVIISPNQPMSLGNIVKHKLNLWAGKHWNDVPETKEMREWMELAAKWAAADKDAAEAENIRRNTFKKDG